MTRTSLANRMMVVTGSSPFDFGTSSSCGAAGAGGDWAGVVVVVAVVADGGMFGFVASACGCALSFGLSDGLSSWIGFVGRGCSGGARLASLGGGCLAGAFCCTVDEGADGRS